MKKKCPDLSEFADIARLEEHHPLQRHLAQCPRCRALLKSREVFATQSELHAEEEKRCLDADEKITAFLEETLFPQGKDSESATADSRSASPSDGQPKIFKMVTPKRLYFGLWSGAAAALLVVALSLWTDLPDRIGLPFFRDPISSEVIMRGGESEQQRAFAFPTTRYDNGVLTLEWGARDKTETYAIEFWSESLQVIATIPAGAVTAIRFTDQAAKIPAGAIFFCVIALAGEEEIDRSEMVSLP
jgi:hypothetical protein